MNLDEWKAFVNNLFVDKNGKRKPAVIALTLESGDAKLVFPPVEVAHSDTLQQVFIKVDKVLAKANSAATAHKEDNGVDIGNRLKAVNVEHITHGNTEYIVYRMSDESFRVVKTSGEVVAPKGIIYNTVVKKYREKFNLA
jgi:hypothetical protein